MKAIRNWFTKNVINNLFGAAREEITMYPPSTLSTPLLKDSAEKITPPITERTRTMSSESLDSESGSYKPPEFVPSAKDRTLSIDRGAMETPNTMESMSPRPESTMSIRTASMDSEDDVDEEEEEEVVHDFTEEDIIEVADTKPPTRGERFMSALGLASPETKSRVAMSKLTATEASVIERATTTNLSRAQGVKIAMEEKITAARSIAAAAQPMRDTLERLNREVPAQEARLQRLNSSIEPLTLEDRDLDVQINARKLSIQPLETLAMSTDSITADNLTEHSENLVAKAKSVKITAKQVDDLKAELAQLESRKASITKQKLKANAIAGNLRAEVAANRKERSELLAKYKGKAKELSRLLVNAHTTISEEREVEILKGLINAGGDLVKYSQMKLADPAAKAVVSSRDEAQAAIDKAHGATVDRAKGVSKIERVILAKAKAKSQLAEVGTREGAFAVARDAYIAQNEKVNVKSAEVKQAGERVFGAEEALKTLEKITIPAKELEVRKLREQHAVKLESMQWALKIPMKKRVDELEKLNEEKGRLSSELSQINNSSHPSIQSHDYAADAGGRFASDGTSIDQEKQARMRIEFESKIARLEGRAGILSHTSGPEGYYATDQDIKAVLDAQKELHELKTKKREELKGKITEAKTSLRTAEAVLRKEESELSVARDALKKAEKAFAPIQVASAAVIRRSQLELEMTSARQNESKLIRDIAAAEKEILTRKLILIDQQGSLGAAVSSMKQANSAMQRAQSAVDAAKKPLTSQEKTVKTLKRTFDSLTDQLVAINTSVKKLQPQDGLHSDPLASKNLTQAMAKRDEILVKYKKAEEKYNAAVESRSALSAKVKSLEAELATQIQKHTTAMQSVSQKEGELAGTKTSLVELTGTLKEQELLLAETTREIAEKTKEFASLKTTSKDGARAESALVSALDAKAAVKGDGGTPEEDLYKAVKARLRANGAIPAADSEAKELKKRDKQEAIERIGEVVEEMLSAVPQSQLKPKVRPGEVVTLWESAAAAGRLARSKGMSSSPAGGSPHPPSSPSAVLHRGDKEREI